MTSPSEPNDPPDEAIVDTWFAGQYRGMSADLAGTLDLDTGMHEILLAGQHRDMGAALASTLNLDAGLVAICHHPQLPLPTTFGSFTGLLDWLSAAPMTRLTHRSRLRRLAIDAEILHRTSELANVDARDLAHDHPLDQEAFARILTRALGLARRFALDLAFELTQLGAGGYEPDHRSTADLNHAREINRELTHALSLAHDLDRKRELGLQREVDLQGIRTRELENGALVLVWDQNKTLIQTLCETLLKVEVEDLLCAISGHESADVTWLDPATIGPWEADRLNKLAIDFTGVDLRAAVLGGLDLVGVRWSRTTRWPQVDVDWIVAASEPVSDGVYVIHGTSASDTAPVAPDPVSV